MLDELRQLRARRKYVLTGTPLQNHVTELWTILNFLEPRKFSDCDGFLREYGALSTGGGTVSQVKALSRLLRPHLLRREKADVETLQPMQETTITIEITNLQKVCYRALWSAPHLTLPRLASSRLASHRTLLRSATAQSSSTLDLT